MNKKEIDLKFSDISELPELLSHKITKLNWFLSNGQMALLTCCNSKMSVNGIISIAWMMPTSHLPFMLLISIGNGKKETGDFSYRACYSLINETKEFGLNIPTTDLTEAIGKIGSTHSDEVDKFAEAGLTPMESKKISAPLISECFLNIECKVLQQFVTGDHTVFVAEPVAAYVDDDVIVDGKFSEKYRDKSKQVHMGDFITMWNMW
ncbi:MAG: flavin reductase family protein [Mariniphaga sp.]|nr:flavin reductase family protein [Mariniphaga sp.]